MRSLLLESLEIGSITASAYFTEDGDMLINQGVTITDQHIEALKRRHFTKVFTTDTPEEDELHRILSRNFTVGELDIMESRHYIATENFSSETIPHITLPPSLKHISKGQEGLLQLAKSEKATTLDGKIKSGVTSDKPRGLALKEVAREMSVAERTDVYKNKMSMTYTEALENVTFILKALAEGNKISGRDIKAIVERFVQTFITDRNILLNISNIKPKGNDYTFSHSLNVCLLSINIGASIGYNKEQILEIGIGGLLHDVGMLLIPAEIRSKSTRLSEDEWFEVQKHPILGLHLLEEVSFLPDSTPYIAYQCHERENGKGYPKQRSNRFIHNFAKIVQIADIYEALSSPRAYRQALIPYKAMEALIKMTRQGLVSAEFLKAMLLYTSLFPVGSLVELSDHSIGKVIKANGSSLSKPLVSILVDKNGNRLVADKFFQVDLTKENNLQIIKAHASDYLEGIDTMDGF